MRVRIDHVVIHVSDWERSNAFYRDVLALREASAGRRGQTTGLDE